MNSFPPGSTLMCHTMASFSGAYFAVPVLVCNSGQGR